MELSVGELNERYRHFWKGVTEKFNETISTRPEVLCEALDDLEADSIRYPLERLRSLEQAVMDVDAKRSLHQRDFSKRGVEARQTDLLSKVIDDIVRQKPNISCPELLATLDRRQRIPPISEINLENAEIYLCNKQVVPVSGLKDRLSRAKKKFKSRNR